MLSMLKCTSFTRVYHIIIKKLHNERIIFSKTANQHCQDDAIFLCITVICDIIYGSAKQTNNKNTSKDAPAYQLPLR